MILAKGRIDHEVNAALAEEGRIIRVHGFSHFPLDHLPPFPIALNIRDNFVEFRQGLEQLGMNVPPAASVADDRRFQFFHLRFLIPRS